MTMIISAVIMFDNHHFRRTDINPISVKMQYSGSILAYSKCRSIIILLFSPVYHYGVLVHTRVFENMQKCQTSNRPIVKTIDNSASQNTH